MSNLRNKTILDVKNGYITDPGSYDKVILLGNYIDENSDYAEDLELLLYRSNNSGVIRSKLPYSGYNMQLFICDFNDDKTQEIIVRGDYGGSGGYAISSVYEYADEGLKEIFSPDMFSEKYPMRAQYLDNYKVLVEVPELNRKFIIDISNKPAIYLKKIYDSDGKVTSKDQPTVSAVNQVYPIKMTNKKNSSLIVWQRIIGQSNADTIGYIVSFVDLGSGDIEVEEIGFYDSGSKIHENRVKDKNLNRCMRNNNTIYVSPDKLGLKREQCTINYSYHIKD